MSTEDPGSLEEAVAITSDPARRLRRWTQEWIRTGSLAARRGAVAAAREVGPENEDIRLGLESIMLADQTTEYIEYYWTAQHFGNFTAQVGRKAWYERHAQEAFVRGTEETGGV